MISLPILTSLITSNRMPCQAKLVKMSRRNSAHPISTHSKLKTKKTIIDKRWKVSSITLLRKIKWIIALMVVAGVVVEAVDTTKSRVMAVMEDKIIALATVNAWWILRKWASRISESPFKVSLIQTWKISSKAYLALATMRKGKCGSWKKQIRVIWYKQSVITAKKITFL